MQMDHTEDLHVRTGFASRLACNQKWWNGNETEIDPCTHKMPSIFRHISNAFDSRCFRGNGKMSTVQMMEAAVGTCSCTRAHGQNHGAEKNSCLCTEHGKRSFAASFSHDDFRALKPALRIANHSQPMICIYASVFARARVNERRNETSSVCTGRPGAARRPVPVCHY